MRKLLLAIMIGVFMAPGTVVAQKSERLCSAFIPDRWRDTITLHDWVGGIHKLVCGDFVSSTGAQWMQLGCTTPKGPVWGEPMPPKQARVEPQNFPKPNDCYWQND
jgi:hypothetical protein